MTGFAPGAFRAVARLCPLLNILSKAQGPGLRAQARAQAVAATQLAQKLLLKIAWLTAAVEFLGLGGQTRLLRARGSA